MQSVRTRQTGNAQINNWVKLVSVVSSIKIYLQTSQSSNIYGDYFALPELKIPLFLRNV